METYFVPVIPKCETGAYPTVSLVGAMSDGFVLGKVGPLGDALRRYAGGVVTLHGERAGNLILQSDGTFCLTTTPQAKRLIEQSVTGWIQVKLEHGAVCEAFLADRPSLDSEMLKIATTRFAKQIEKERKPMTPEEALEKVVREIYANPRILRKDGSIAPGAYAAPVKEFNPQPRVRQETPPAGTSVRAISLARFRQAWPTVGQHLGAAMRANPGSREIGAAGQEWAALDQVGLGIDSRFLEGTFSVPVTPDNAALAEAWAHSTATRWRRHKLLSEKATPRGNR